MPTDKDININTKSFSIGISTSDQHDVLVKGYFKHNKLGGECSGELWFESKELTGYGGVIGLPEQVVLALREHGFNVDDNCGPDSMITPKQPDATQEEADGAYLFRCPETGLLAKTINNGHIAVTDGCNTDYVNIRDGQYTMESDHFSRSVPMRAFLTKVAANIVNDDAPYNAPAGREKIASLREQARLLTAQADKLEGIVPARIEDPEAKMKSCAGMGHSFSPD